MSRNNLKIKTKPATPKGAAYNPVVFSRTKTYNKPSGSSLPSAVPAGIIHQTDANGNHTPIHAEQKRRGENTSLNKDQDYQKSLSRLFKNLCCCLGFGEVADVSPPITEKKEERSGKYVLPPLAELDAGKKCLVLDLDETLVHSSFRFTNDPDYIIPVEIENNVHSVYVRKRPLVDQFLLEMSKHYEIVVYTASLSKYADPLLDQLDTHKVIRHRLFREHCTHHEGTYVKNLSLLDRDLSQCIIIDNSPLSYVFHPENAIGCTSFIDDLADRELPSIQHFLESIRDEADVRDHLHLWSPNMVVG